MESLETIEACTLITAPIQWKTLMDWTTSEAYAYGRTDPEAPVYRNPRHPIQIARDAVDEWTAAQYEHSETSFYGAHRVRAMRAYWLGRLRTARN